MKFRRLLPVAVISVAVSGFLIYHTQVNTDARRKLVEDKRSLDARQWGSAHTEGNTRQQENKVTAGSACSPERKFVFIKTHKTGSCTAVNILQRYVLHHNLAVLSPIGGWVLAWPFPPAEEDYVHTPDEKYDVLINHMVYNKTWLRTKFPPDTAYISIIREPSSHLKSAMFYYYLPQLLKITSKNPVQTFLQDPWKYKDLSEAYFDFCHVTWDGTRNHQAFDLGYPTKAAEDLEHARRYISDLEADFTLVLLLEHLDESLVLLRRLMCWDLREVLYDASPKNSRNYGWVIDSQMLGYKSYVPTAAELANLRQWKAVDYLLYDTFNASLWRKIAAQGPDFHEELRYFKDLKDRVSRFCRGRQEGRADMIVTASRWNPRFVVDADYCHGLKASAAELFSTIRKRLPEKMDHDRTLRRISVNMHAIVRGQPTFKYNSQARRHKN
ncbi:galactose-3-O-sulfotransferase 2-like [Branchiostoma floridae]|uniref:Galactose-3-O-sulfotransferase 2-like n=1 Tax=Branchiostoma floridae TaxID=7739 RepID=A0A9J7LPP4_BRAFL|nr:galactose-3-O-sulfotransferase 2-like [Branchiostoma floridae]